MNFNCGKNNLNKIFRSLKYRLIIESLYTYRRLKAFKVEYFFRTCVCNWITQPNALPIHDQTFDHNSKNPIQGHPDEHGDCPHLRPPLPALPRRPRRCESRRHIIVNPLTHSFLTAKDLFTRFFFTFFYAIFKFLRPEHDCYARFTSCST